MLDFIKKRVSDIVRDSKQAFYEGLGEEELLDPKIKAAFHTLGFDEKVPLERIKERYRSLSKKYHPDLHGNLYIKRFLQIKEAYEILKKYSK